MTKAEGKAGSVPGMVGSLMLVGSDVIDVRLVPTYRENSECGGSATEYKDRDMRLQLGADCFASGSGRPATD
jgi:hypothetical protein